MTTRGLPDTAIRRGLTKASCMGCYGAFGGSTTSSWTATEIPFDALQNPPTAQISDGIIKTNPLDKITNIARDDDVETANPFSREEIQKIAAAEK